MSAGLPKASAQFSGIKDEFKFCEIHDNKAVWDIPESCKLDSAINHQQNTQQAYYVLNKRSNEVSGQGWYCTATNREVHTYVSFWGTKQISRNERNPLQLTNEDCWELINTKQCNKHPMSCKGDYCISDFKPQETYTWMATEITKWTDCDRRRARHIKNLNSTNKNIELFIPRTLL